VQPSCYIIWAAGDWNDFRAMRWKREANLVWFY